MITAVSKEITNRFGKGFLILILSIISLGLLTGCTPSSTTQGIDGNDITKYNKLSELSDGDVWMQKVCSNIEGYETGKITSITSSPDIEIPDNDRKRYLLIAQDILKARDLTDYPQFELYRLGTVEELASPGANSEQYRSLKLACTAYHQLDLNLQKNYLEPILASGGCWRTNDTSSIGAKLQERISGKWVTLETQNQVFQIAYCGGEYPYGVTFSIERSKSDDKSRSVRLVWVPRNGSDLDGRTNEYATCPKFFGPATNKALELGSEPCTN